MDQLPITIIGVHAEDLSNAQRQVMTNKIRNLVTANGLSATGSTQFAIFADFVVVDETATQMLEILYDVEGELTLNLVQAGNEVVFNSVTIPLEGSSAGSKAKAVNNAVRQLRANNAELRDFIRNSKAKIVEYYAKQCESILDDAYRLFGLGQHEQAMAILLSVPKEVDCHERATNMVIDVYIDFREQGCERLLQRARAALAANDYELGLALLSAVDPEATCSVDAILMIEATAPLVDEDDRRRWNAQIERLRRRDELESQRIEAAQNIAMYYLNRPQTNLFIVR